MKRVLALLAILCGVAVLTGFSTGSAATRGTVYIGMDAPLHRSAGRRRPGRP